jgi:predicted dehydrogenase
MDTPLRVAIAGAGIGATYAECFSHVPATEVVALCTRSRTTAGPVAERLGIPGVFTDFDAMLAGAEPDIVVIATPNDLHHEMALQALAAGAHLMCDKPVAMDARQAREMWHAAEERGLRHVVPFWWRLLPSVARARELLADGSFGEPFFAFVRYLNCGFGDPLGPMRWQFESSHSGSGALANVGSHAIAALHWLAGDLVRVCATSAINVPERRWPDGRTARPDVEDTVALVAELANGAPVSFLATSVAHEVRSSFQLGLHLAHGSVVIDAESHWPQGGEARLRVMRRGDAEPSEQPTGGHGRALVPVDAELPAQEAAYVTVAAELADAIRSGRPAAPGLEEGVRVQEVIDAALASQAEGRWVSVDRAPAPVSG